MIIMMHEPKKMNDLLLRGLTSKLWNLKSDVEQTRKRKHGLDLYWIIILETFIISFAILKLFRSLINSSLSVLFQTGVYKQREEHKHIGVHFFKHPNGNPGLHVFVFLLVRVNVKIIQPADWQMKGKTAQHYPKAIADSSRAAHAQQLPLEIIHPSTSSHWKSIIRLPFPSSTPTWKRGELCWRREKSLAAI